MLNRYLELIDTLVINNQWVRLDDYTVTSKLHHGEHKEIDLTLLALVHGNEKLGLSILNTLLERFIEGDLSTNSSLCFSLGNVDAYKVGKRYIEKDLNRILGLNEQCHESKAAQRLEKVLSNTKYMLDLHQTIDDIDTTLFVSTFEKENIDFCHQISSNTKVITYTDKSLSFGNDTDEFVNGCNGVGITLELGGIGNDDFLGFGVDSCLKAIKYVDKTNKIQTPKSLKELYQIVEKVNIQENSKLMEGLKNFTKIKANELYSLGAQSLRSENDLYSLFPRYGNNERVILSEKITLGRLKEKVLEDKLVKRETSFNDESLTEVEVFGLSAKYNLSDGHSYINAYKYFKQVITNLPRIWKEATDNSIPQMEEYFKTSFADYYSLQGLHNQKKYSICPTASNSIDLVGAWAKLTNSKIGLVEPTFDNLALLIKRRGAELVSLEEEDLVDIDVLRGRIRNEKLNSIFIVNPNNPTGKVLLSSDIQAIAELCKEESITLIMDTSFRFCHRIQFDDYKILQDIGVSYIILEDTGKCWPTLDTKASLLSYSDDIASDMRLLYEEIYLCSSNLSLGIIAEFIKETQKMGGVNFIHNLIDKRYEMVKEKLKNTPLQFEERNHLSCMSIVWLSTRETGMTGLELVKYLSRFDISLLPGRFFYWNSNKTRGNFNVRLALMKKEEELYSSVEALEHVLEQIMLDDTIRLPSHSQKVVASNV